MDSRDLQKVDLNLLVALQMLLEENNVSRAAERLFITQPAMSKTLARLREVFDDPLFTRGSRGMLPTPRAEALRPELSQVLASISDLVAPVEFDPATFSGEISLALSEYIGVSLLPPLVSKLHKLAPALSLRAITRVENQLEQLSQGQLDFAIQIEQAHYGADFRVEPIGDNPPAVLLRSDHPLTRGKLSWKRLAAFPVIRLYISDMEQLEVVKTSETFNRIRHPNQAHLEISHLLTALEVLRHSDYYMPGPTFILQNPSATSGIVALPLPDEEDYRIRYMLTTHRRTSCSPIHQWFREQLLATIGDIRREEPSE